MLIAPQGAALFAIDLDQLRAGQPAIVDAKTSLGYPVPLASLPAGDYYAQAIVNVVRAGEARGRQDDLGALQRRHAGGHADRRRQRVQRRAEDSRRQRRHREAAASTRPSQRQPRPQDTEWVKHARIQSQKLTAFWGRPVYIYATVLLPKGYNEHPNVKYPTVYTFGHNVPFSLNPDSTRVRGIGQINPVTGLETGYDFYKSWISDGFPRFIAVSFEQATPFFLDSYSVNSAQQRTVRRRDGRGGHSGAREAVPHDRRSRMRGSRRARRRADGRRSRCSSSIPTSSAARGCCSRTRSIFGAISSWTSTRTRTRS